MCEPTLCIVSVNSISFGNRKTSLLHCSAYIYYCVSGNAATSENTAEKTAGETAASESASECMSDDDSTKDPNYGPKQDDIDSDDSNAPHDIIPPPIIPHFDIDKMLSAKPEHADKVKKKRTVQDIAVAIHSKRLNTLLDANNMIRKPVYGDGECFFTAALFQVDFEDAPTLRETLCQHMEDNMPAYWEFFPSNHQDENDRYLSALNSIQNLKKRGA